MEPTKDSKNTTEKTTTNIDNDTAPVVQQESVAVVENLEKDATVVTGQAGDQPVTVVMNPPKKHKAGIIIGIVVFLLFLIGGGSLAAWYFCVYNSPEVIAYDAMRQLLSAEHVSTIGTIRIAESESQDGFVNVAELKLASSSMSLPNSTSVSLNLSQRYKDNDQVVDDHELSLDLGLAAMSDGVIYLQVENLADTFDQALDAQGIALEDLDAIGQFAYAVVELVDNQWWQISVKDVLEELNFDDSISNPIVDFYNCLMAASQERTDIAKLYDAHRFVKIEKTEQQATTAGTTRYQMTLDRAALAAYVNALPSTAGAEKAIVCYNALADEFDFDSISATDFPEIDVEDLEKELPGDYTAYLEIANFSHQLKRIEVQGSTDDTKVDGDLTFEYSAVDVTPPSDYRPITDLFEEIFELVGEYFYGPDFIGLDDFEIDQDAGIMMM